MMERFLERVSISSFRDNFILKGGMLVAPIVGVEMRATMDIDTTVKALPLNEADVQRIIEEICNIPLEDNVSFQIKSTRTIMEEFDYPGIRVMLEATLDRMRQPIKIDISTDDVITPKAIEYNYKLMFEDRTISVLTYNKKTLLAEKMQTIINRGIANTRLRDFYDVYSIMNFYGEQIEKQVLCDAFSATCEKRKTIFTKDDIEATFVIHPSYRGQDYGELYYNLISDFFRDRGFKAVKLFCEPRTSEQFWRKMGLVRFTDCGQTEHELTYYGVLWDVEPYEAEETNPKGIWYIEIQDDRLLYPIIQPCNCNWNLRWSRNGTVIKEAKVKYFTDEAYKLYCDQFLYIKELAIEH